MVELIKKLIKKCVEVLVFAVREHGRVLEEQTRDGASDALKKLL